MPGVGVVIAYPELVDIADIRGKYRNRDPFDGVRKEADVRAYEVRLHVHRSDTCTRSEGGYALLDDGIYIYLYIYVYMYMYMYLYGCMFEYSYIHIYLLYFSV